MQIYWNRKRKEKKGKKKKKSLSQFHTAARCGYWTGVNSDCDGRRNWSARLGLTHYPAILEAIANIKEPLNTLTMHALF